MTFLKNMTLAICVLSLAHTAIMMLVPDRFRSEMRSVTALIAVVTLSSMFIHADISDISLELGKISFESKAVSRNELVQRELESRISEYIASFLEEDGVRIKKVSVGTTIDEQYSIFITEVGLILDPSESSREEQIRGTVTEKIGDIEVKIGYEEN